MTNAKQLFDAGRLREAIQSVTQEVKSRPTDVRARTFLFELLCLDGDFDRALKQLDVLASQSANPEDAMAVQVYRDLITAEQTRRAVFHATALPKFFFPPPGYIEAYVVIVQQLAAAPAEAAGRLAAAEEQLPAWTGRYGEELFSSFRDADDRVAGVFEVFHGPNYLWLPIDQVRRIRVDEPRSLRNMIWARAEIETNDASVGSVFLPALYVDTPGHPDDQVRLGRDTDWRVVEDQLVCGAGARQFLVDGREVPLLELRDVQFNAAEGRAA